MKLTQAQARRMVRLIGGGMPQATPYAYCFVLTSTEAK